MVYTTQLLIALAYISDTKLMLRQSSSTLVNYVNYLIGISININEIVEVKENLSKRKTMKKRCGKLIHVSHYSFTHLFNIQMTKLIYSWMSMKYWK